MDVLVENEILMEVKINETGRILTSVITIHAPMVNKRNTHMKTLIHRPLLPLHSGRMIPALWQYCQTVLASNHRPVLLMLLPLLPQVQSLGL